MATVKMKKGKKFADIFDSPETIKQAQLDGYSLVEKKVEPARRDGGQNSEQARHETKSLNR